MSNIMHLLKVVALWVSIVYTVCFFGVLLFPSIRADFMLYALHSKANLGESILTFGSFLSGLILWNLLAALGVWLFVLLYNRIQR
ncbi:MAG: DUF5676 family membrane protein [Candidatus Moraniibacteriota bacterium]